MKELELVLAEEDMLEKGAKFKKVAYLEKFGLSKHQCKEHNSTFVPPKTSLKLKLFFDADPDRRDKACKFGEV